ncbi:unnamed protein product [Symbiodinium natans]|uniref:Uncharacterized protein n=1 Tax=Symbiodinium natans TaxID=878477 RepID=A0A812S7G5_9DINO|nr:unnamed protein product [Symbiodinium natans]
MFWTRDWTRGALLAGLKFEGLRHFCRNQRHGRPTAWRLYSTSIQCDSRTSIDELAASIRKRMSDNTSCVVDCSSTDTVYWSLLALRRAAEQVQAEQRRVKMPHCLYMVPEEIKSTDDSSKELASSERESFHPRLRILSAFEWNLSGAGDRFLVSRWTNTALAAGLVVGRLPDQGTALRAAGRKAAAKAFKIVASANTFLKRRRRLEEGMTFAVSVGLEARNEGHMGELVVLTCGLLHAKSGLPDRAGRASRLQAVES